MANITRFWPALLVLLVWASARVASADDNIFPPAPAAASAISFDGRGFLIHGKRTFIASGGMEYARIPRALWRDRLLRLKRAGFNCVEIYTFWNYHEPRPGQFDFSGDKDLDAFLKTAKSLDLYAIVRVGPYVCAEWDSGGYPIWLRFVPGLRVREDNPPFIAAVDRYWDKLMPIVAANQINHGGSVILVQLENEDPEGWGRVLPNSYFVHLRDKAVSLGLQVPYFFSGLHHGSDPAGDTPWRSTGRQSPWMTTEFWSLWYDRYGQTQVDADTYDRRMWKVLAYGGNGLNFYMLHGGSNFGTTNDDEDTASYDYGAAIGQAGDLRPTYYRFKRAALFARSVESILADSDDATDAYKNSASNPSVRVTARKSSSGTILFLDNPTNRTVTTQIKGAGGSLFPAGGPITLGPGQILPYVQSFALAPDVTLNNANGILGIWKQGKTTTIVTHGKIGDPVEMQLGVISRPKSPAGTQVMLGATAFVKEKVKAGEPKAYTLGTGSGSVRILVMTTDLADRTWPIDDKIIVGPDFVGDTASENGTLTVTAEGAEAMGNKTYVYDSTKQSKQMVYSGPVTLSPNMPSFGPGLSAWQTVPGNVEATPSYSDADWKSSTDPLPMGADSDPGAYAWYRSEVDVPKAGIYTLRFTHGGDWASAFVNGQHAGSGAVAKGVTVPLPAGPSRLAVLTAHYGRPKLVGYLGPIDTIDAKGLSGPVILDRGTASGPAITNWRVETNTDDAHAAPPTDTTGAGWTDGTTGPDIFNGRRGFAWYVTSLPALAGAHHRLHFENVDDNATVFLNGKQVAAHQGWGQAFDASLDAAWNPTGVNTLAVLVENTDGGGGIQGAVTLEAINDGDEVSVTGWKMHGGIAEPGALTGWKAGAVASADGSPAYYRATFNGGPPAATGTHPILRVTTTGLSQGFLWLNGHNLGRYPEKIPVNGLYLPEPWLNAGRNTLVIFDEEGHTPSGVTLTVEQAASRFVIPMTEKP